MSNADYSLKLEEVKAIPAKQVVSPAGIPVSTFDQECEYRHEKCQGDHDALVAVGLDWTVIEDMPVRVGALRHATSLWNIARDKRVKASTEWKKANPEAYDLRARLIHDFLFAFDGRDDLLRVVRRIASHSGHPNMVQDLSDLSVLGKQEQTLLEAIHFDVTLLDLAEQQADAMAVLYARATGADAEYIETRDIKDRCYTHLKEANDLLVKYGKYVFWRDKARMAKYTSEYIRQRSSAKSADAEPDEQPVDADGRDTPTQGDVEPVAEAA